MSKTYTIADCRLIELNKISRAEGNLTVIEGGEQIPFDIKRVYYIYDIPAGSQRGGHAHKELFQLVIAVAGSFNIFIDDGLEQRNFLLDHPYTGLIITPMIWRVIDKFSSGSVCLALASAQFDESDYYRDYDEFISAASRIRSCLT